jgi:hypothetical protein
MEPLESVDLAIENWEKGGTSGIKYSEQFTGFLFRDDVCRDNIRESQTTGGPMTDLSPLHWPRFSLGGRRSGSALWFTASFAIFLGSSLNSHVG